MSSCRRELPPHFFGLTLERNGVSQSELTFLLPLKEVKEFQFQTRPLEWAEFQNVSVRPAPAPAPPKK
jgi:hypothetical protein